MKKLLLAAAAACLLSSCSGKPAIGDDADVLAKLHPAVSVAVALRGPLWLVAFALLVRAIERELNRKKK